MSILYDWPHFNKLVAHENETKLMLFTSIIHLVQHEIRFNQNSFECVSHIKYLGIVFKNKLPFKLHITDVSQKCRYDIYDET